MQFLTWGRQGEALVASWLSVMHCLFLVCYKVNFEMLQGLNLALEEFRQAFS